MKPKKIIIKNKITNHLILNGKKEISEIILLKTCKELQKTVIKPSKQLIHLAVIFSMPVFRVYQVTKKAKKKKIKQIPIIISDKKARVSLSIKFILTHLKNKNLKYFYVKFYQEIILNAKMESSSVQIKKKIQNEALLKKHFFHYYRW